MMKKYLSIAVVASMYSCTMGDMASENTVTASVDYDTLTVEEKHMPQYATAGLVVREGLQATLFASEPMLVNPTNMDIDARGRVWVNEGYNYRPALNPNNPLRPEGDRIVIMEDTNEDGVADKSTVFYQGNEINAALGIAVLGNKVIVSSSPNVWVFTDTDGDDKADKKELLFTGMGGEQHDHAVHAFTFGPDGKLYFNYGNEGGQIKDAKGNPVIDQYGMEVAGTGKPYWHGMIFRVNPDGTDFEVLAHNFRNNYEVAVDSYGTLWQSDNDDDGNRGVRINYVMEGGNFGYRDEMTGASWETPRTGMSDSIPLRHWHLNDPGVVPNMLQTGAGSPTGILVYEGSLLPRVFHNQIIHSDAGPNVVRAYPATKSGAGYSATIENIVNSKDQWFRPSDVSVAPDGSLFIADWFDPGVGGHQMGDQRGGRIYRIAPPQTPYKVSRPDVSTIEGAIEALKSPNNATRYLGWQMLHESGVAAQKELEKLWNSDNQPHRARALWLLAKLDGKGGQYVQKALADKNTDIRITALRIANAEDLDFGGALRKLVKDPDVQVRREAAVQMKDYKGPDAPELWAQLALQHQAGDRWYLEALGIAADDRWNSFFAKWEEKAGAQGLASAAGKEIIWRSRADKTPELLARLISENRGDFSNNLKYFRAFDFQKSASRNDELRRLADMPSPHKEQVSLLVLRHLDEDQLKKTPQFNKLLSDVLTSVKGTQAYLDIVKKYDLGDQEQELFRLVLQKPDTTIGRQAVRILLDQEKDKLVRSAIFGEDRKKATAVMTALMHTNNAKARKIKQEAFINKSLDLEVRKKAIQSWGWGWDGEEELLALAKKNQIPEELKATAADVLLKAWRSHIKQDAEEIFKPTVAGKSEALASTEQLVMLSGNAAHGKLVFDRSCKICHQVKDEGANFGPGLTEIGSKLPKEALYASILQPDAGISFGYEGYRIKLKDGSEVVGIIENETAKSLVIKQAGGYKATYDVKDVASKEKLSMSLMPTGMEKGMTQEELVDLVEYLASLKK